MAGIDEAADPIPYVNDSEVVKRKDAGSSSKSKAKAKALRKRALKEDSVADGPPRKKARTSGKKSASGPTVAAMDVDRDLMDVIAADEDPHGELGLAVEVPILDSRRGSERPDKAGSGVTRVDSKEVLDEDAELLLAHDGPAPERQPSTEPEIKGSAKWSRGSSPPPPLVFLPETDEILSTEWENEKEDQNAVRNGNGTAGRPRCVDFPPPIKLRKPSGKGKKPTKRDLLAESPTPGPQATDDAIAKAADEAGPNEPQPECAPSAAVSTPPAPRPVMFRKPQRQRIPTLEEATPAGPSLPEISELVTQSDIGPLSFEKNADSGSTDPLVLVLAIDDEESFSK